MPYNIRAEDNNNSNRWSIGDIGENYVKYKLSQKKIDSIIIDRTYDLFLWQRMHRIEVKAANLNKKNSYYKFSFKFWQTKKDAFDYAVCCCIDDENNISHYYIIPQPYIASMADKNGHYSVSIKESNKSLFMLDGNSYDLYKPCLNLDFDMFLQDNKSVFTRKKNALTKKLQDYPIIHRMNVLKEVKKAFGKDGFKHPTKELVKKYNCSWDVITKLRRMLSIENTSPMFRKVSNGKGLKVTIRELWDKGHTRAEMCALLGIGTMRMGSICNEMNLPLRNPNRTHPLTNNDDKDVKNSIRKLWRKGHTRTEMSALLSIGTVRLGRLCKELTLPYKNPYRKEYLIRESKK